MNLLNHRFFTYFSDAGAKSLAEYSEEVTLNDETILFNEADPSECVYLLLEGRVELSKSSGGDKQVGILTVEAGDYFGEMGVLDNNPRSTCATCRGLTRVAKVPGPPLLRILHQEPAYVTLQFLRTILEPLRRANERFVAEVLKKENSQPSGGKIDAR